MNWIVGAILILIIAILFDLGLLAYAMYALLGITLVSRHLSNQWSNSLVASRHCNRLSAEVGDKIAVVIDIENRGVLPIPWFLLEDQLPRHALIHDPPCLKVHGIRLKLATLRANGRSSLLYQLEANRRGYYQIGPLVLETGDLFGLHRRYRITTSPHFLLVYPRVITLEGYDIRSRRPIGEITMTHRLYEDPTRIAGVRKYESGDPLSLVHWKTTARMGTLHSKVLEASSVAGATIVLDFHTASFDRKHEPFRSELAITAVASIANTLYEINQQVGLVTNGRDAADRIRQEGWQYGYRSREAARRAARMLETSDRLRPVIVKTKRGADQFVRIKETLARLELTGGLTIWELIAETESQIPRDATVIALLTHASVQAIDCLGSLRRRGYATTAVVNVYEEYDFSSAAGKFLSESIPVHHLKDEESIKRICRRLRMDGE